MRTETSSNIRTLRRPANVGSSAGRRLRANWPAKIKAGPTRSPCTLIDVSSTGACIALDRAVEEDVPFWLTIEKMAPISATIVWRKGCHVGLRFLDEQQWISETYKQRFDPAAWLRN